MPVDVLMISFRTESDATRDNTAEQNIRGFRPMSAAISACRNLKLCPCLLALDCWRVTGYSELTAREIRNLRVDGNSSGISSLASVNAYACENNRIEVILPNEAGR